MAHTVITTNRLQEFLLKITVQIYQMNQLDVPVYIHDRIYTTNVMAYVVNLDVPVYIHDRKYATKVVAYVVTLKYFLLYNYNFFK